MKTISLIAQLIYPLLLMAVPAWQMWTEKKRKRGLMPYFLSVAFRPNARKFIRKVLILALLALPTIHMCTLPSLLWMMPTAFILLPCCFSKVAERMLFLLKERRHFMATFFIIFVCFYVPHLLPVAISLGTVMAASLMYPTRELVEEVRHPNFVTQVVAMRCECEKANRKLTPTQIITLTYEKTTNRSKES